ncbi:MAG: hypothetical protein AAF597_08045, partial [Bacteroidota bacterium]
TRMPEASPLVILKRQPTKHTYRYTIVDKNYKVVYTVIQTPPTKRVIGINHVKMSSERLEKRIEEE